MPNVIHMLAGIVAPLCVATFLCSTVLVGLFGSEAALAQVKSLIVAPGLLILIPALMCAGGSGMFLSRKRKGRLVTAKKSRMPIIAANGLLVLVPCALLLDHWAALEFVGPEFLMVQALELIAGSINLTLMTRNVIDGLRLSGRIRTAPGKRAAEADIPEMTP